MRLKNKVVLVTGGAKRVGREIALSLASRGAHVAITYRTSKSAAEQTVRAIKAKKVKALAFHVDQREPQAVRQVVRDLIKAWGRVDLLVNNASSFPKTPLGRVTDAQWDEAIATNLTGPWWFAREAGLQMKRQGAGKIINMLDVSVTSPWVDCLPYSAAKGGLWTLTLGLAKALGPEVQVNGIAPGPILWPPDMSERAKQSALKRTVLKRRGAPKDIAETVVFFAEGSDFITGTILPVDGGRRLA